MHKKYSAAIVLATLLVITGCAEDTSQQKDIQQAEPTPLELTREVPLENKEVQMSEFHFIVPDTVSLRQWIDPRQEGTVYSLFRDEKVVAYFTCPIPDIDYENGGMGKRTDGVTKERMYTKNGIKYIFRLTTFGKGDAVLGFVSPYSEIEKGPNMNGGCSFSAHSSNITAQEKEQIFESMY